MSPDDFSHIDLNELRQNRQWQTQYRLLMEWGKMVRSKPEIRVPQNKIRGCATDAWLCFEGGIFYFDSDSRIINGLATLLLSQDPQKLQQHDTQFWQDFLQELGLQRHLSPSRNNGFQALVRRTYELLKQLPPAPVTQEG